MLSYGRRFLLAFFLVFLSALVVAAPVEKPTAKEIAQWVQELGDNKFSVRERASKKLWAAGSAAEPALEEAKKSDDAEVVRRARDILDKFKWGIYPDTPADVVALIRAYQAADNGGRVEIVPKLLQNGLAGLQAVFKIARNEKDDNQRKFLVGLISNNLPAVLPQVLEHDDYEKFESLLEIGYDNSFIDHNQYTAYWLLRGKLDERIAHFRSLLEKNPDEKRYAETLAYLYRAKGDLAEARQAAEKAKRDDLLEGILYEAADWKALAERPALANQREVEKWPYRAAYARLAGDQKAFENAVSALRKFAEAKPPNEIRAYVAAKALLLNDRPREGLDMLVSAVGPGTTQLHINVEAMHFEILCAQMKYDEAMKFAEEARSKEIAEQKLLEILKARTLYLFGEKDKAQALFARVAGEIKEGTNASWVSTLLETEYKIGLKDQAFKHCAQALSVSLVSDDENVKPDKLCLGKVFPKQSETAKAWLELLRQKHKEETNAATLKRLRDLMEGKLAAKEVKAWIEEADRALAAPKPEAHPALRRQALAEAAVAAGLDDMALSLLEKADTPAALLRLGDLLADKKQWAKAAERYRQAWRKSVTPGEPVKSADPLPLFLAGDALVKAGQEKEGKQLMEQSHWMPLGDAKARFNFLRVLIERGHGKAAERETNLLLGVSAPNVSEPNVIDQSSLYSGAALRQLAVAAAARKEYLKAADGFEQSMLRCLHEGISFAQNGAYAAVPSQVHQLRARGLLAAGKLDEARKHIERALDYLPGNVDLPIAVVPELERRGHKKEAVALFERSFGTHEKVCRDYPRCSWAHNSVAWLCACCRRDLDKGLEHARKAVELAPDNAGYLDTLAEIHFQRGDKDKAVALQKRAIELDPKKPYFRKQLKRLEAGDPSAERPPENDEE